MARIINISEASSLAFHAIVMLAAVDGRMLTTHQIATVLGVSEAHLSKVLQRLAKARLVIGVRGPRGGFELARPADEISLLMVYEAIEGKFEDVKCLLGDPVCDGTKCIVGKLMDTINREARKYLSAAKLSNLAAVYEGIDELKLDPT